MKNRNFFKIKNIPIGENYPPVIITELGINHDGDLNKAIYLVDKAIDAGAEIIKHQTHIAEAEMSDEAKQIIPKHINTSIFEIIKKCSLSEKEEYKLKKYIENKKKIFISTPFSFEAVDRLKKFNVPAFKIGSGECNNYPLIDYIAKLKKPVILSTGMNSIKTIKPSVKILEKYRVPYVLMHCTNLYPTPNKLIRLQAIRTLKLNFPKAIVGLSDHSTSIYPCIASVAVGARVIEKHFTDTKKRKGADISSSMDFKEHKELKSAIKIIFDSRGHKKIPVKEEKDTMNFAFASVVAKRNIKKNRKLNINDITLKRPSGGHFGPNDYFSMIGKRVKQNIIQGKRIQKSDFEK